MVQRWVLQDPDLLTSWTFPINPNKMSTPHAARSLHILVTIPSVSPTSAGRVFEGNPEPFEWTFSGYIRTEAHYEDLLAWTGKVNRLYLTDHLSRTWWIRMTAFDVDEQRPTGLRAWRFNYDIKTMNYGPVAP